MKNTKEVSHAVPAPLLCLPAFDMGHIILFYCSVTHDIIQQKPDPRSVYQADFTHIISFHLHSAAEYEGVEVGLLENLIEGSFVLQFKSICSEDSSRYPTTLLCSNPDLEEF